MIHAALVFAIAVSAPPPAPEAPRGVQAVAMATVEIVAAARGTFEPGPQEPRRQVRRNSTGQTIVEFE